MQAFGGATSIIDYAHKTGNTKMEEAMKLSNKNGSSNDTAEDSVEQSASSRSLFGARWPKYTVPG